MNSFRWLGTLALTAALLPGVSMAHADEVNCPICGMTLNSHEAKTSPGLRINILLLAKTEPLR
ncbi:MAG: hypothetical protein H7308_04130 [Chthonomonadaceae bacterium]|nr:hypothetical protein [Chthonomonadaceae bacterium]